LQLAGLPLLQDLLKHLGLTAPNSWDAIIVGDGSGQGWKSGGGWCGILIDRYSVQRKLCYGMLNPGTVTLAELIPYIHVLDWYTDHAGPGRRRQKELQANGRNMEIHIVTDSQVIATCGMHPESRHSHQALWASIDAFRTLGYGITFHHIPRDVVDLNILADAISRQARLGLEGTYDRAIAELQKHYPGLPKEATIYDFSPNS
jgi:hypothetical protein